MRGKEPGATVLPWNLPLRFGPTGPLGKALGTAGIYDLAVTETIFRLLESGDRAIDVGANVGYMTSIMARRVGPQGSVLSFEPQPEIAAILRDNVERWRCPDEAVGEVTVYEVALSNEPGQRSLRIPQDTDANHERASLRELQGEGYSVPVKAARLDEVLERGSEIALLKIDAERHELEVLLGATESLPSVRTLILEEHEEPPTDVTRMLSARGFDLLTVHESFLGPRLLALRPGQPHLGWGPPNLVATRERERVDRALAPRGWRSLAGRRTRAPG
jgi:FkbM family methyltransferase